MCELARPQSEGETCKVDWDRSRTCCSYFGDAVDLASSPFCEGLSNRISYAVFCLKKQNPSLSLSLSLSSFPVSNLCLTWRGLRLTSSGSERGRDELAASAQICS